MLAGLFVSDGIKAEQGPVLAPTGFNTSFPLLSAPETWGKEATRPSGSTGNCTTPRERRQLAALQIEELAWDLRFAGVTASSLCVQWFLNGDKLLSRAAESWQRSS